MNAVIPPGSRSRLLSRRWAVATHPRLLGDATPARVARLLVQLVERFAQVDHPVLEIGVAPDVRHDRCRTGVAEQAPRRNPGARLGWRARCAAPKSLEQRRGLSEVERQAPGTRKPLNASAAGITPARSSSAAR